jgi:hypothetical protein
MRALIEYPTPGPVTTALALDSWALLPIINRPLIDYHMELCLACGIHHVTIISHQPSEDLIRYAEDGSRWGLALTHHTAKGHSNPLSWLRTLGDEWASEGLLHLHGAIFPLHKEAIPPACHTQEPEAYLHGRSCMFLGGNTKDVSQWTQGNTTRFSSFESNGLTPIPLETLYDYYRLNMDLARTEGSSYVTPGYGRGPGNSLVGSSVSCATSAAINPPVIVGDNSHIGSKARLGPGTVVGNNVFVAPHATIQHSVILDHTYIGKHVHIDRRIVTGSRVIDPYTGAFTDIQDDWLVASA